MYYCDILTTSFKYNFSIIHEITHYFTNRTHTVFV
jgi:hypothetical protein